MRTQACRTHDAATGRAALDALVSEHADLVKKIAHNLAARLPPSVDVGDLVQAGMIGLMEASGQFEAGHGASFTTFASIRIRGAMLDEIRRSDWVPRSVHRGMRDAALAMRRVEQCKGRAATAAEVAAAMNLPIADYQKLLANAARGQVFSLDEHIEHAGEPRLAVNAPPAEQDLERAEFRQELATAIDALPEREKLLLSLYYEQQMNMREIAAVLGVTESRVCQLHGQAMVRLRARLARWNADDAQA
jgi:RNA polymerase sigma factor for flagellar operon FliA